eukprot:1160965-Pelagomonas_calceolata.AAC.2
MIALAATKDEFLTGISGTYTGPSLLAARGGLFGQMEQLWNVSEFPRCIEERFEQIATPVVGREAASGQTSACMGLQITIPGREVVPKVRKTYRESTVKPPAKAALDARQIEKCCSAMSMQRSVGDGRGLPCALLDAACAEGEATDLGLRFMILPAFLDAARTGGEVTNLGLHLKVLFASAVAHFGEQVSMRTQPRSSCCALSI